MTAAMTLLTPLLPARAALACASSATASARPACSFARLASPASTEAFGNGLLAKNHGLRRASGSGGPQVVCMAHPRRVARVARQLEREIGELFVRDKRMRAAISPEEALGVDSAVSAIASVTEVRLSNDLQVAKVYVSVLSDAHGTSVAMTNLIKKTGYVRKKVGESMRMRLIPEIRFVPDDSIPRGNAVLAIMDRLAAERDGGEGVQPPVVVRGGEVEAAKVGRSKKAAAAAAEGGGAGQQRGKMTLEDLDNMEDEELDSLWDDVEGDSEWEKSAKN